MRAERRGGFSLIEAVVAITILGLVTVPLCSGLLLAHRINARTEQLMQAQYAVTRTVEELMASGITGASEDYGSFPGVTVRTEASGDAYQVTVRSGEVADVVITTYIRGSGGSA